MNYKMGAAAVIAAAMTLAVSPSISAQVEMTSAEKIKKLDIMLMVSSLRCRNGPDNFRPAYQRFNTRHLNSLNGAHREVQTQLAMRHGHRGAKRVLDRLSVSMANQYGQGHPWMSCAELSAATIRLADTGGPAELLDAADHMLGHRPATDTGLQIAAR